ncbi:MAG: hypothetical protein M1281_14310 [Chloroflexi bacterium]|nr:hypothetical protein [Chloroflexota bacterium]
MEPLKQARKSTPWRLRSGERRLLLVLGDALAASLALLAALYFWGEADTWLHDFSLEFLKTRPQFWFYLLPVAWIVLMVELYDVRRAHRKSDTLRGVSVAALISLGIYLVIFFIMASDKLPRRGVAIFIAAAFLLTLAARFIYITIFTSPQFIRRVLIVGAGDTGTALLPYLPL